MATEEIPQPIANTPDPGAAWQEVDRMLGGLRKDWVCIRYEHESTRFERHMRPIQEEIKLVLVRRDLYDAGYRGDWAYE